MSLDTPSRTELNGDETVVLYPSFGQRIAGDTEWRIQVCGTVYEQGSVSLRQRLLLRLLQKAMKVDPEEIAQDLFQRRVRAFIAPTERGRRVSLRIGDRLHRLPKATKRNGRFMGSLRLAADQIGSLEESGDLIDGWLRMSVELSDGSGVKCGGHVRLIENSGLSVISDIDDTIKLTEVHCRPTLLTNTFLREFRPDRGHGPVVPRLVGAGSDLPLRVIESLAAVRIAGRTPRSGRLSRRHLSPALVPASRPCSCGVCCWCGGREKRWPCIRCCARFPGVGFCWSVIRRNATRKSTGGWLASSVIRLRPS